MSQDLLTTDNPVTDTMTKVFDWLGKLIDQLMPRPPAAPSPRHLPTLACGHRQFKIQDKRA